MSIKVIAEGFIPEQPPLIQVGLTVKCEFDVCAKRSVKNRQTGAFEEVQEYATFIAWGEEAEKLSDTLVPGREVSAMGIQETSRWIDSATQQKRSRKVFKLIHLEIKRRAPAQQGQDKQDPGRAAPRNQNRNYQHRDNPQSRQPEGHYDDGYDDGNPEPLVRQPPRQEPRQQRSRAPDQAGKPEATGQSQQSRFGVIY